MSAGRARRIAPVGGARRLLGARRRRRVHLLLAEAEREEQLRQRPLGGHLDDVGQVAVLDPRCACRGVDVSEQLRRLARRERVVAQTDPGVPAA